MLRQSNNLFLGLIVSIFKRSNNYYYLNVIFLFPPFFYPSVKHVMVLNVGLLTISVLFAMFLPNIGTIIR